VKQFLPELPVILSSHYSWTGFKPRCAQGNYIFDTMGFSFQATVIDVAEGNEYLHWILACDQRVVAHRK
jgi:hypothetical protein